MPHILKSRPHCTVEKQIYLFNQSMCLNQNLQPIHMFESESSSNPSAYFRIFNQSMFQNSINSSNPIVIQCCQLYHNFFKVGNTAFTLIRKEHHHPLLPPQRICSGATLWRQIMTVSSGRDFDQSKASFLRLSCQIGWAKSIFHVDCWL